MSEKTTKNDIAIHVEHVSKEFRVYLDKGVYLKERVLFRKRRRYEDRKVLKDISFDVKKGEAIGLIGENGCGKSTTLKMLTRIMFPDTGRITIEGRVSALIELGAGFHPDLSGRENIYTNAAIFGLSREEIDKRLQTIIDFSGLGEYIENPVRTYSSGMYMRLAFAVAINVDADVLLIDEILAVGDVAFQAKCFDKLQEIKEKGTTIVIVSHSLGQIEQICERSYWIDQGLIRMSGKPKDVHAAYLDYMEQKSNMALSEAEAGAETDCNDQSTQKTEKCLRTGSGEVRLDRVRILGEDGKEKDTFQTGERLEIIADYHTTRPVTDAVIGFGIFRADGVHVTGTNTLIDHLGDVELKEQGTIRCEISALNLVAGEYLFDLAVHSNTMHAYDDWREIQRMTVVSDTADIGVVHLDHRWEFQ